MSLLQNLSLRVKQVKLIVLKLRTAASKSCRFFIFLVIYSLAGSAFALAALSLAVRAAARSAS